MVNAKRAVLFMEEAVASETGKPLMLEAILSCPILSWMSNQLLADGVERFFVVCDPEFAEEAGACFPAGTDVTVSAMQKDLTAFLNTPDPVLVLNRSAIPLAEAGEGFAYEAPGYELQEAWKVKMTNAVQAATLVSGWVPVWSRDVIAELEPILKARR